MEDNATCFYLKIKAFIVTYYLVSVAKIMQTPKNLGIVSKLTYQRACYIKKNNLQHTVKTETEK